MPSPKYGLPAVVNEPGAPESAAVDFFFASMGRDGADELQAATELLLSIPMLQEILDAMPLPVAVLNDKGQVLLTNARYAKMAHVAADCDLGKRHGELLCCIHAKGPEGCGTSGHCRGCGASVSISSSLTSDTQSVREYHLRRESSRGEEALELAVSSTPIRVSGRTFTIFAIQDLSPERIRDSLGLVRLLESTA